MVNIPFLSLLTILDNNVKETDYELLEKQKFIFNFKTA
jgi:hypothetical protein